MRVAGALLLSAVVVPCLSTDGGGGAQYHEVSRREENFPSFRKSVLGDHSALSQGPPSFLREHMFIADISVGTPPQPMKCLLDSGTADIWIPSRRCRSCEKGRHFRADKSETFMPAVARTAQGLMPVPVRMDYKSGEVVGFLVQDTISIGRTTLQNQSFLIVEEAKLPKHREWDGICGLGWHQMAAEGTGQPLYKHFQPMYKNMQQRADARPIFSLVPAHDRQAYIVVGDVPTAALKEGSLAWLPAEPVVEGSPKSFWAVRGSMQAQDQDPVPARFLVDTASPFLFAPRDVFPDFVRSLLPDGHFDEHCGADANANNLVVCSCDGLSAMVWVQLGQSGFRLDTDRLFKRVPESGGSEELCLLAIQPNPLKSMDPMELLGDLLTASDGTRAADEELDDVDPTGGQPPYVMPALPFLVPIAEALNASFIKGHAGGAPITIPVAVPNGSLQGLLQRPLLPPVNGEEQMEQIVETKPDGTTCITTLVWNAEKLKQNTTECHAKDEAKSRRRLSDGPADTQPGDLWVLGGPFLEHFVTIMDFENSRIGFAEPIGQGGDMLERAIQVSNPDPEESAMVVGAEGGPAAEPASLDGGPEGSEDPVVHAGGFPWGPLVVLTCLGSVAGLAYRVQQRTKRRKNLAFGMTEDTLPLEEDGVAAE